MKQYSHPKTGLTVAGLFLPLVCSLPVLAHHSLAAFDLDRERVAEGTVVAFDWVSPHTVTFVALEEPAGTVLELEGMSPDYLGRRGWHRRTLAPGDQVRVAYFPSKSGAPEGLMLRVTQADGTVRVMIDNP